MMQQDGGLSAAPAEGVRRPVFFQRPPDNFDPLRARADELARYGIPPRPDAALQRLAGFWEEMFKPPLHFSPGDWTLRDPQVPLSHHLRMITTSRRESSLNWSGAYITPRDGQQFTEVHGRWEVPDVAAPAGTVGNPEFRSSVWIGLDGQRRYIDSSLPQIGTAQFLNPKTGPPFSIWWQWWMRDNPATFEPYVTDVAVQPGHRIMASLRVVNQRKVHFVIENRTTNAIFPPFTMDAPAHLITKQPVKVSGATAEWIVERPADPVLGVYDLPDYDHVDFRSCFAISAHLPHGGVPGPGRERTLDGARLISMYKTERNPSRSVIISKPERPDRDQFTTNFVNP